MSLDSDGELAALGLDDGRLKEIDELGRDRTTVSRVIRMDRGWATLQAVAEIRRVPLRECPRIIVGDWLVEGPDGLERLHRRTLLTRRAVSERVEPQLMAANVDVVVVTWALDSRVGTNRLKELIVMARDSGAQVLVVLTKADLLPERAAVVLEEVADVLDHVEVLAMDARQGAGLVALHRATAGRTIVFLGASGAGKSTLTNLLRGDDAQETAAVGRTGEGRHTTTSRELFALPGGGSIIDSPGIRDVTVWGDGEGLRATFPDLDEIAQECRFSDCSHRGIDGCALELAVAEGRIECDRRTAYLDFLDEQRALDEERAQLARKIGRAKNRRRPT